MQRTQIVDLPLDEGVRRKEGRIVPLIGILLAAAPDEIEHVWTPRVGIGQSRCRLGRDDKDGPQRVEVGMRRGTLGHFYARDAQTPNIGPTVVMRLSNHFWGHPKGTANHCLALVDGVGQLGTDAEIGQLDMSVVGE